LSAISQLSEQFSHDQLNPKEEGERSVNERDFPFVVKIAVPDGGFECTLDAINAWHHYSRNPQYRGQPHSRVSTAGDSVFGAADQDTEDKRAGSTLV
jgi:hypothetical protein